MEFNNGDWGCGNALMYIFFSDSDRASSKVEYSEILKAHLLYVLSNPDEYNGHELLDVEDLNLVKRLIKNIRLLPAKITGESQLAPIVWIKLAIQISFTGIPIANKFLTKYGKWREECQYSGKLILVLQDAADTKSTKTSSSNNSDSIACSLDVFLLTDIEKFNPSKYTYSIQYKSIDINDEGVAQKSKTPTTKARDKKSARDQIGENICRDVEWCINEAADLKFGRIQLHRDPNEPKFTYYETRTHLLGRLREKFGERLKGSNSDDAYLRAITLFVTCKGCKRSLKAPKKTKTKSRKAKRFSIHLKTLART